ncbi:MAG: hypothetical protein AUI11_11770 [Acidobacteria bacterium 13_2_20CM_2_66_4]|nr:MAG: hypothetical protein AUI11_11770 [Acidobacteria bacterium 13_2_20CM_2_66_4]
MSASTLVASTRPRRSTMSPRTPGASMVRMCCFSARAARSACRTTWRYTRRASIAVTHSARNAATAAIRPLSVARQTFEPGAPVPISGAAISAAR